MEFALRKNKFNNKYVAVYREVKRAKARLLFNNSDVVCSITMYMIPTIMNWIDYLNSRSYTIVSTHRSYKTTIVNYLSTAILVFIKFFIFTTS